MLCGSTERRAAQLCVYGMVVPGLKSISLTDYTSLSEGDQARPIIGVLPPQVLEE